MPHVDERHLHALLGSAGKNIARLPGARHVLAKLRLARSAEDLAVVLQDLDLGLDEAARNAIWEAACDEKRWRQTHAALLRSAEQQLVERFWASS